MRQTPSLIAVRRITSERPRSAFDPQAIEEVARLILSSGGLVDPLIVTRRGLESFALRDGEFAYQAAVRARELDPLNGEMVLAFIAEDGTDDSLILQAETLKRGFPGRIAEASRVVDPDFEKVMRNNENRMEQVFADFGSRLAKENKELRESIAALQDRLPRPIDALECFNAADGPKLLDLLCLGGINPKRAEKIGAALLAARQEGPFRSLGDASERLRGLSAAGLLKLVDAWSKVSLNAP